MSMSEIYWEKILTTTDLFQAELLKAKLEDAGLEVRLLNKMDSSYGLVGGFGGASVEIYTSVLEAEKALKIIQADE